MLKWQKTHRLVGSSDPVWIVRNLFLDSLLFLHLLPADARDVVDLGAGAGLPGIPMKIVRSELHLTLVESRRRRASFLSTVVRELGLSETRVFSERAERLLPELEGQFDAVVMRCAGRPSVMVPVADRFLRPGGVVVVSAPPTPTPLPLLEPVTVPGLDGGSRQFLVHRHS